MTLRDKVALVTGGSRGIGVPKQRFALWCQPISITLAAILFLLRLRD